MHLCVIFRTNLDVFQLKISVNDALTVYELESIGDASRPSNYTSRDTRYCGQVYSPDSGRCVPSSFSCRVPSRKLLSADLLL